MPVTTAAARCAPRTRRRAAPARRPAHDARQSSRSDARSGRDPSDRTRSSRFHPALDRPEGALRLRAEVAVIQGCGYPDYSLSHEESRLIWQSGRPAAASTSPAPAGSAATSRPTTAGSDIPGGEHLRRRRGRVPSDRDQRARDRRLRDFGFPYDDYSDADDRRQARRLRGAVRRGGAGRHSRRCTTSATSGDRDAARERELPAAARRLRRRRGRPSTTPTTPSTAAPRATSARSRR